MGFSHLPKDGCWDGSRRSAADKVVISSIRFRGLAGDIGLFTVELLVADISSLLNLGGSLRDSDAFSNRPLTPPSPQLSTKSKSMVFLVGFGARSFDVLSLVVSFAIGSLLPLLPVLDVLFARGLLLFGLTILLLLLLLTLPRLLALVLLDRVVVRNCEEYSSLIK